MFIRDKRNAYKTYSEVPKRRERLEIIVADGTIILKFILKKEGVKFWTRLIWLRIRISGGLL
jgi:hypothetical protein